MLREKTIITTEKIIIKTDGRCKMKLTRGMLLYFGFWILYLPASIVLTLLLDYNLEQFFVSLGLGALLLLLFLTGRLIVLKLFCKKSVIAPSVTVCNSETPNPKDNMDGFRNMFAEVQQ